MPDDGCWTHVKRKTRRKHAAAAATPSSHATAAPADAFAPRTTGILRPAEALRRDHDKVRAQWDASSACRALAELVAEHATGIRVTKAVCLGTGSFDPDDGAAAGACESRRAAHVQLCAFSTLTSQLEKHAGGRIDRFVQEPILTASDAALLTSLGHSVVESPAAYAVIDDETLLFAVHLYRPVYAAALQGTLPAVFVGTGWDVWDTVTLESSSDLDSMKKMHESYSRHDFPQDASSTAFSSTSIYFCPVGRADKAGDNHVAEGCADGELAISKDDKDVTAEKKQRNVTQG